jgi:uncharacterized protein YjbI with pentapeptide repeats
MVLIAATGMYLVAGRTSSSAASSRTSTSHGRGRPSVGRVSMLFVSSARSGRFVRVPGSADVYTLKLAGLDRDVVWFADRPARVAGTEPAAGFVAHWKAYGFETSPPNAALVLDAGLAGQDTVVGQLSAPSFDATSGIVTASFTVFSGQRLAGVGGSLADKAARARGAMLPQSFGAVSMFVDDAAEPAVGGCPLVAYTNCPLQSYSSAINATAFPATVTVDWSNFSGDRFDGATFGNANFANADMVGASFAGATFQEVVFAGADMENANLAGTDGVFVDFAGANLTGTNLSQAVFSRGTFADANLDGANLQGAQFGATSGGAITNGATICTDGSHGPCTGTNLSA